MKLKIINIMMLVVNLIILFLMTYLIYKIDNVFINIFYIMTWALIFYNYLENKYYILFEFDKYNNMNEQYLRAINESEVRDIIIYDKVSGVVRNETKNLDYYGVNK